MSNKHVLYDIYQMAYYKPNYIIANLYIEFLCTILWKNICAVIEPETAKTEFVRLPIPVLAKTHIGGNFSTAGF